MHDSGAGVLTERVEEPGGPEAALDEDDAGLLDAVRRMWVAADPMPSGLVERIQLRLDLDAVEAEVARLIELPELAAARSDGASRLLTFESDSLTIMVSVGTCAAGTARIDGWLTPPAGHRVELNCEAGPVDAESDDTGRFSLPSVPPGRAWLTVHGRSGRVDTPAFEI